MQKDQYRRESQNQHCLTMPARTRWLVLLAICFGSIGGGLVPASAEEPTPLVIVEPSVKPTDGANLTIIESLEEGHRLIVGTTNPVHNWFMGSFQGLKTDADTVVGLSLEGNDAGGNQASVAKWAGKPGLIPVFTYGDPERYETYEWYVKDPQGRWVSGDPFKVGNARYAGNGIVPQQVGLPADIARCGLITGKNQQQYFQCWSEIESAEAVTTLNIYRMRQRFQAPQVTLAMKVPFTDTYLDQYLQRLQEARFPGVTIETVGMTAHGRPLRIIRLDDPKTTPQADTTTICLYAREHATEHPSSWALLGALNTLLEPSETASALRAGRTWIFIPLLDPDGAAASTFDRLTDRFYKSTSPATPPEVLAYARYFTDYIDHGRTIDLVVSLHSVEANEAPNLFCPFRNTAYSDEVVAINRLIFSAVTRQGLKAADPTYQWNTGFMSRRLSGWLAMRFGALDLHYEVNDRFPANRLSLPELQFIGAALVEQLAGWSATPPARQLHTTLGERLQRHRQANTAYLTQRGSALKRYTQHTLLNLGFSLRQQGVKE